MNSIAYVEVLSEEMLVNVSLRDKSAKGIARDIYLQNKTETNIFDLLTIWYEQNDWELNKLKGMRQKNVKQKIK